MNQSNNIFLLWCSVCVALFDGLQEYTIISFLPVSFVFHFILFVFSCLTELQQKAKIFFPAMKFLVKRRVLQFTIMHNACYFS